MSDPRGDFCVENRLLAHKQLRSLGLTGHEEAVGFAILSGESVARISRKYRIPEKQVRNIVNYIKELAKQKNKKETRHGY